MTSQTPLPLSGNHIGFLQVLLKAELEFAERPEADIIADFQAIACQGDAVAFVERMHAMVEARAPAD